MSQVKETHITANSRLDLEWIIRLLLHFKVISVETMHECRRTEVIIVGASIEAVDAALSRFLGSVDWGTQ